MNFAFSSPAENLEAASAAWLRDLEEQGCSPRTITSYALTVRDFIECFATEEDGFPGTRTIRRAALSRQRHPPARFTRYRAVIRHDQQKGRFRHKGTGRRMDRRLCGMAFRPRHAPCQGRHRRQRRALRGLEAYWQRRGVPVSGGGSRPASAPKCLSVRENKKPPLTDGVKGGSIGAL